MNHDMSERSPVDPAPETGREPTSRPRTELWSDHRQRTTRAIIEAFVDLLHGDNPAAISMPKVAASAGVSTRTLYRYFPDKDALMDAASGWFDTDARDAVGGVVTADNAPQYLAELWTLLAANIPAVHAQHVGGAGRELRRRRLGRARRNLSRTLANEVRADRLADTVDLVAALMSSSMMLELVDRMGHPPEKAAALAARLVELAVADGAGQFDADRPDHEHRDADVPSVQEPEREETP